MSEPQYSDRQVQIIDAAIKLMGEGGIQMLTTKNLAREVSVTEPALYRHFSSKANLILQVLEYLKSRIIYRLTCIVDSDNTPVEKLRELVKRQFQAFVSRPEIVVVLLSEGLSERQRTLFHCLFDHAGIFLFLLTGYQEWTGFW